MAMHEMLPYCAKCDRVHIGSCDLYGWSKKLLPDWYMPPPPIPLTDMLKQQAEHFRWVKAEVEAQRQPQAPWDLGGVPKVYAVDPAKPGTDVTVKGAIKQYEPPKPAFDIDRAWDMVVLAARTSRYGDG